MLLVISSIGGKHTQTQTHMNFLENAILRYHRCAGLHQCMSGLQNVKHKINQFYSTLQLAKYPAITHTAIVIAI